jgi:UDP-glucose:(heptosyl)LPS alpha-1,3-glucosyltransferase
MTTTDTTYKLAFVVSMFFEFGGMQRSLLRIARACQARGHEVHLYTGELRGDAPKDLPLTLLNTRAWSNVASNDRLATAFHRVINGQGYDCLVGFTKIAGLDVYYAGDPCYAARVADSKPWYYRLLPRYRGLRRQESYVFRRGTKTEILLFAHQEKDRYQQYYATEDERFHMLPPGINRERLLQNRPDSNDALILKQELGMKHNDRMVLLVGAFFGTKGVDRAIKAMAALPAEVREETVLVVVGNDDASRYRQLAEKLHVTAHVIFAGGREDIARFYYAADALIHPAYTENTGTAILEAMVCGVPVLATANCGFASHVEQAAAGLVCPMPFAQDTLNQQLMQLLTSKQRADWRQNALHYVAAEDLYGLIDQAAEVIIQCAARHRQAGGRR